MTRQSIVAICAFAVAMATVALANTLPNAQAKPQPTTVACDQKQYTAEVLRVVDGDTLVVMVDLGLDIYHKTKVRLIGIDTPEVYGKDRDPVRGPAATKAAQAWVQYQPDARVIYVDHGVDKYGGRRDGELFPLSGGPSLSESLIQAGHEK